MSDKEEQVDGDAASEARVKAAFSRLGVVLDDDNGGDTDLVVAALNGVADRMEVLVIARDGLASDLAQLKGLLDEAGYTVVDDGDLQAKVNAAFTRLADVEKSYADLLPDYDAIVIERDKLTGELRDANLELTEARRQVTAWKGQATKAREKHAATAAELAEVHERNPQAKARTLPGDLPVVGADDTAGLLEMIDGAKSAEIVAFLDGSEALAVEPMAIRDAGALKPGGSGLVLSIDKWIVPGPAAVNGYGLYLDGELAAFRPRDAGQLAIGVGQQFNLAPDVLI